MPSERQAMVCKNREKLQGRQCGRGCEVVYYVQKEKAMRVVYSMDNVSKGRASSWRVGKLCKVLIFPNVIWPQGPERFPRFDSGEHLSGADPQ